MAQYPLRRKTDCPKCGDEVWLAYNERTKEQFYKCANIGCTFRVTLK